MAYTPTPEYGVKKDGWQKWVHRLIYAVAGFAFGYFVVIHWPW